MREKKRTLGDVQSVSNQQAQGKQAADVGAMWTQTPNTSGRSNGQ